jgi:hypothetical protein
MAVSTIDSSGLTSPLTATNLGTPSAINLSNATSLAKAALPTGSVLQVVNATYTTQTTNNTGSFVSSGLSASITPSSSSNKILIFASGGDVSTTSNSTGVAHALYRGTSTQLNQYSNQGPVYIGTGGNFYIGTGPSTSYLDSPSTTSSVTYYVYFKPQSAGATATVQRDGTYSSLTLMEISA